MKKIPNQLSPINIRNILYAGSGKRRKLIIIRKLKVLQLITKTEKFQKNSLPKIDNTEK